MCTSCADITAHFTQTPPGNVSEYQFTLSVPTGMAWKGVSGTISLNYTINYGHILGDFFAILSSPWYKVSTYEPRQIVSFYLDVDPDKAMIGGDFDPYEHPKYLA